MDPKYIQQRPGEEQKITDSLKGKLSNQGQPIRNVGAEALRSPRADLKRAHNEYHQGNYARVVSILHELIGRLEQDSPLYAAACTLMALSNERLGHGEEAHTDFSRAVRVFDQLPSTEELPNQHYAEYGVSLFYMVGRQEEAMNYLRHAISLGVVTAETYRHLGLALKDREEYEEAKMQLKRALELASEDPLVHKALQEIFEVQGRLHEMASAYREVALAMIASQPDEALSVLNRALILKPDDIETLAIRGEVLRTLGRYEEALEMLERALVMEPGYVFALDIKGQVLRALNRDEEAIETFLSVVEMNPEMAWAHAELGDLLRVLGRNEEALAALDRALDLEPGYAFALWTKGQVLRALNCNEEALAALQNAAEMSPDVASVHAELGDLLRVLGRNEEALAALDRALDLEPGYAFALWTRGQALRALGSDEEAVEAFLSVVEINPEMPWAHAELGDALRVLGRNEEALAALDRALDLEPRYAFALGIKGGALYALERYEEALAELDLALALESGYAFALGVKGQVLRALGKDEKAVEALRGAVEIDPDMAWVHAELGDAMLMQGHYEEALATVNQALASQPDHIWALGIKGETLRILGRHEEALLALDLALALEPGYAFALGTKGGALYALERYDEALKALDQALDLEPGNAWALMTKGQILFDIADYQLAIQVLDQAVHYGLSAAWIFIIKGSALENLGVEHVEEAREAYETARDLESENLHVSLYVNVGLGDTSYVLGNVEEAREKFRWVIDQTAKADTGVKKDTEILHIIGWCHYRLGQYEEAVRAFIDALALDTHAIYTHFDLALALMCDGRYSRALREYTLTIESARGKHVLRRRGLLYVARRDLKEAVDNEELGLKEVKEAQKALNLLREAFERAEKEAARNRIKEGIKQ